MQPENKTRILWLDVAKAYGILFVYYAHVILPFAHKEIAPATLSYRFLSYFTIPIFFLVSGFFVKDRLPDFKIYLIKWFNAALIPYYFFNIFSLIILLTVQLFYKGPLVLVLPFPLPELFLAMIVAGSSVFNGPAWFLICIFITQIIYFFISGFVSKNSKLILSMVVFSIAGYLVSFPLLRPETVAKVIRYFWFIPSALTGIVFFQMGILLRRTEVMRVFNSRKMILLGLFVSGALTLLTFNLNDFSRYGSYWNAVFLNQLIYGNYFIFYFTAITGMAFVIFLSMLTKPGKLILFYGQNTLVLLGLNGIFFHYINPSLHELIKIICNNQNVFLFLAVSIGLAFLELALCYPFIGISNRILKSLVQFSTFVINKNQEARQSSLISRAKKTR